MPFFNTTAWVIGAEDGDQCSASADTVVIQSDDEDHHANHIVFVGSLESLSHKASSKKAAAMCEACDEGIVTVATCLSGNQKLCETCDLADLVDELAEALRICRGFVDAYGQPETKERLDAILARIDGETVA